MKTRLDIRLVKSGLIPARQKAHDYIKSGRVTVNGSVVIRPGFRVYQDAKIEVGAVDDYVSRGAHKLAHALKVFQIDLQDKICLDVGASTGGFTQVCLKNGAKQVFAVDVGTNQLHSSLKNHPQVVSLEQTHIQDLVLPHKVDFVCVDVSFISLKHVIPHLPRLLAADYQIVLLVKPQYEVGRENLPADGIVVDEIQHQQVVHEIISACAAHTLLCRARDVSPVTGKAGNKEFLLHLA